MTIKTAIIGYGRNGSTMHAGAIERNSFLELTDVCDIEKKARKKAKERFGCRVWEDYKEMIKNKKFDLVVIVTKSNQHCKMTCDCLAAGNNVLVTKPWAVNADEARKMIKVSKQSKTKLLPWLPARWGSVYRELKKIVKRKEIGEIFMIKSLVSSFSKRKDWQTLKQYGGGYLLNWGPHVVEPPVLLSGGRPVSVFGKLKQVINPGDVEDVFTANIITDNGVIINTEYNQCAKALPEWVICGDKGTVFAIGDKIEIHKMTFPKDMDNTKYGNQPEEEIIEKTVEGEKYGNVDMIYKEIVEYILDKREYSVKPEQALKLSVWLDAIRESSKKNRSVTL